MCDASETNPHVGWNLFRNDELGGGVDVEENVL